MHSYCSSQRLGVCSNFPAHPIPPWLVGSACEHPGWYLLAFPAESESYPRWHCCPTMCWGPGSDFGHTNHRLGFFSWGFSSPGNCWHQLGSGGVWEQSQSSPLEGRGFILPTCLKLGGMSVQETPKSCRWRNALAKESKREKKGF